MPGHKAAPLTDVKQRNNTAPNTLPKAPFT